MEEQKLELRLGPPGDHDGALLTLGYNSNNNSCGIKRGLESNLLEVKTGGERNWLTNNKSTGSTNTEKRIAVAPVVGWPPIGSFRKNLATSSSPKAAFESPNEVSKVLLSENVENPGNSLFVKVKMDGVPIGRKIDLKAYNNYETLSSAVDELFRSLLAAQMHHAVNLEGEEMVEKKAISGLSKGNGEYTLVYEDNEGDRMLAGDVPWHVGRMKGLAALHDVYSARNVNVFVDLLQHVCVHGEEASCAENIRTFIRTSQQQEAWTGTTWFRNKGMKTKVNSPSSKVPAFGIFTF